MADRDPSVSPADTTELALTQLRGGAEGDGTYLTATRCAALLAVVERDKAELARWRELQAKADASPAKALRRFLRVSVVLSREPGRVRREALAELQRMEIERERDRKHIERLTGLEVELQHRHRIMVHALRVVLDGAESVGFDTTRRRLERLYGELQSNRPMQEWSLARIMDDAAVLADKEDERERDRRHIERLTEALEQIAMRPCRARRPFDAAPNCGRCDTCVARAVLADKEDAE